MAGFRSRWGYSLRSYSTFFRSLLEEGSAVLRTPSWKCFSTEDVKTVQEFLRDANSRITLDVYTQAVTYKRAAQGKVVTMIV